MTRDCPFAGPAVSRVCFLHLEGSRPAPHQEGWALEALKYAGSYVPPTSLALSPSAAANCNFERRPQMTLAAKSPEGEALPARRGPLRTREALRPSAPFQARFGCQFDPLSRCHTPKGAWHSSQPCATHRPEGKNARLAYRYRPETTRSRNWRRASPQITARRPRPA
jgi:hypothetical protein